MQIKNRDIDKLTRMGRKNRQLKNIKLNFEIKIKSLKRHIKGS